ncbi:alpha/beta hydrolase fold domain-containing protein [uncultured Amnibacterium sp.]|uniref:alpha/beta hydrolase fold domain-containing protein n=1 Tax=uncultured Amnibacterium sp. TaxID=1631851 RepID=UPI0035CA335B
MRARGVEAFLRATGAQRRWRSPEALQRAIDRRPAESSPAPKRLRGVRTRAEHRQGWPVWVLEPQDRHSVGSLVWLHGGGYVFDLAAQHWTFLADLAVRSGRRVLVPRYPLAPEGRAEQTVPTAADLVAELLDAEPSAELPEHGPLALGGDSAGGGMALAVAQELRLRGHGGIPLVLSSPWVDATLSDPAVPAAAALDPWLAPPGLRAAGSAYAGSLGPNDRRASPIHGPLIGLGPVLILTGTRDVLNPDARRLAAALQAAGGQVELLERTGLLHNFPLMPIPEAAPARDAITAFLTREGAS